MNINRPDEFDAVYRISAIQGDRSDDDSNNSKQRKKVQYQGRSWSEEEEDLPLSPSLSDQESPTRAPKHRPAFYADLAQMKLAQALFKHMTTIEEKVAQLIFLKVEANYDPLVQQRLEKTIQQEQIGGLIFIKGEYKREAYLIEHFQGLSKTPLLIGNDFNQGLSFYFQDRPLPKVDQFTQKRASDVGKAVMVQSRRLGVHMQLDQSLGLEAEGTKLAYEEKMAFRKGIRQANGIVGRQLIKEQQEPRKKRAPKFASVGPRTLTPVLTEQNIQEAVGLKTVDLVDLSQATDLKTALLDNKVHTHDAFVLSVDPKKAIEVLADAVREGAISESELEKRVLKILLVKSVVISG